MRQVGNISVLTTKKRNLAHVVHGNVKSTEEKGCFSLFACNFYLPMDLWKEMFFRFRDYFTVSRPTIAKGSKNHPWASCNQQGFPAAWGDKVVQNTGEKFLVPESVKEEQSLYENRKRSIVGL